MLMKSMCDFHVWLPQEFLQYSAVGRSTIQKIFTLWVKVPHGVHYFGESSGGYTKLSTYVFLHVAVSRTLHKFKIYSPTINWYSNSAYIVPIRRLGINTNKHIYIWLKNKIIIMYVEAKMAITKLNLWFKLNYRFIIIKKCQTYVQLSKLYIWHIKFENLIMYDSKIFLII